MTTAGNFWAPETLAIILTRNRPITLLRCVNIALQSIGNAGVIVVMDDSDECYVKENHTILTDRTPSLIPIVHISAKALLYMLNQYLPVSAQSWTRKTAQRDIAPVRNASLLVSNCFNPRYVLLIDDDIVSFDISVTQHWIKQLAQGTVNIVVGANIAGLDERDIISRLAHGIKRACRCTNTESPSVNIRDSFTISPKAAEVPYGTEIVSGGYLSFRFTSRAVEPFPPGYNEDWLWCLSLQNRKMATVFRIPQVVIHDPPEIRSPDEDDLLFELRGDVAFQRELALYRLCEAFAMTVAQQSGAEWRKEQYDHDAPENWIEELLTQIAEHSSQCYASIANQFQTFGLSLIKRMYVDGRFHSNWNNEFDLWKARWEKNRSSFYEAVNNASTVELADSYVQKGKM